MAEFRQNCCFSRNNFLYLVITDYNAVYIFIEHQYTIALEWIVPDHCLRLLLNLGPTAWRVAGLAPNLFLRFCILRFILVKMMLPQTISMSETHCKFIFNLALRQSIWPFSTLPKHVSFPQNSYFHNTET